jgi:hypothetical protein
LHLASSARCASPVKSWCRADTPMLWKRLSVPMGLSPDIWWQLTPATLIGLDPRGRRVSPER